MIDISNLENKNTCVKLLDKLNNNSTDISDLIGVVSVLVYSKQIFPKNKNVCEFIEDIFKEKYPLYVTKSRTLMVAKISRKIYSIEYQEMTAICNRIQGYFILNNNDGVDNINHEENKIQGRKTKNKTKNENDKLETWLKGL
ncbi:hypothetical protein [Cellulosilyticum lentocellum]|uniref:Uncharacterized protein n=1 Tax=Cellulosilyticum lentocellum (strain ATCC 49066 / DSM 5427 / NCIMB 11756 / RHM5) TaxID=642492 RepID=F2JQ28_CELLD|nr:hypothetical protein [Cellulosilyticum lentocellum]ADZ82576.1 hypothetical protein Clole_0843 [Cellulosilyticum lentocellum DSM 5427]